MSRLMLVTGGGRGIGAAIARCAAAAGYRVAVNYVRNEAAAQRVVDDIRAVGGFAIALRADVGRLAEVQTMFKALDESMGRLDVLVNNAGILASFRVDESDPTNVEQVFRANVFSQYWCAREAVRRMSTRHGGSGGVIVNMSSVAARTGGLGGGGAYAGSKGAIDAFTLALAKEVGAEGIRVNALRPGLISTEIHEAHWSIPEMEQTARAAVPMGRAGSADEVAQAALWLASDAASYVHGAVLDVSGGR